MEINSFEIADIDTENLMVTIITEKVIMAGSDIDETPKNIMNDLIDEYNIINWSNDLSFSYYETYDYYISFVIDIYFEDVTSMDMFNVKYI